MAQPARPSQSNPGEDTHLDRRVHEREAVCLYGRLYTSGELYQSCVVVDMSPGGACVEVPEIPGEGSTVVLDLHNIGLLKATVVRVTKRGIGVRFEETAQGYSRLANRLALQLNKDRLPATARREGERYACPGADPVEHEDGTVEAARIKDVSISGVAFFSEKRPEIGSRVRVGVLTGEIARLFDDGYAVRFDPPEDTQETDA